MRSGCLLGSYKFKPGENDAIYLSNDAGDGRLAIFSHSGNRTGIRPGRNSQRVVKPDWIVPFGGSVGRLIRIGKLPVYLKVQAFGNAEKPDGGADWTLQLQVKFLFPK